MVNKKDAIDIILYAEENEIAIWLDGGWGVDALLGEETRVHNDIDLFVEERNSKKTQGDGSFENTRENTREHKGTVLSC